MPQVNGICVEVVKGEMRLKLLLLYRAKEMHPLQFCNNLENIVASQTIDLILGDLNINLYNETDSYQLKQIMGRACYTQIVKDATLVSAGSLIEKVYCLSIIVKIFKCEVKSVYYSDHDSVQICISDRVTNDADKILSEI